MGAEDVDSERATVMTYVPAYQKERWREHADQLGMSQSEFVRTMVQAGRRDFEVPEGGDRDAHPQEKADETGETGDTDLTELERRVVDALSTSEFRSWDGLFEELNADLEERLEDALQRLQASDRVRHSGRHGGYALTDVEENEH